MRNLLSPALARFALRLPGVPSNTEDAGCFEIPSPGTGARLRVIASAGHFGWDHASVSTPKRCPNWIEMCLIKDLFWDPDDCVMQLHVPQEDHISVHPYCLHLWQPHLQTIPRPPPEMVGVKGMTFSEAKALTTEQRIAIQADQSDAIAARLGASFQTKVLKA